MSSSFQPPRHRVAPAVPSPAPVPAGPELTALRRDTQRLARRFVLVNAVPLAVTVLLACTADGLLGAEVIGRINLGMLLALLQVALLIATATLFDQRSAAECDPVTEKLRARSAEPQTTRPDPFDPMVPGFGTGGPRPGAGRTNRGGHGPVSR